MRSSYFGLNFSSKVFAAAELAIATLAAILESVNTDLALLDAFLFSLGILAFGEMTDCGEAKAFGDNGNMVDSLGSSTSIFNGFGGPFLISITSSIASSFGGGERERERSVLLVFVGFFFLYSS